MSTEPSFIERDSEKILNEIIVQYELETGKSLEPAQAERLLLNVVAYRETLLRSKIQEAALKNLVSFSSAPVLDYLGEIVGVFRLPAQPAKATIEFTLVDGHTGVTIPEGTRVRSEDGKAIFQTESSEIVSVGIETVNIECESISLGTQGNGFVSGQINTILDPEAFMVSASNIEETAGGAAQESDDSLKERIKLAPASFSTAGSKDAYIFFTRSANSNIIDVAVTNPIPGTVNIYPLVEGGISTPSQVIEQVEAILSDEKIRPLTDTIEVISPVQKLYSLEVDIEIFNSFVSENVKSNVEDALNDFSTERQGKLGLDITNSKVVSVSMIDGVHLSNVRILDDEDNEIEELEVLETEFAKSSDITVTITGTTDG